MSLDQITKTNIAYKALLGKAHTENIKDLSNEAEGSFMNLPSSKIFIDTIDSDPVVASLDGIVLQIAADLIEDNTSNGHAFFAVYTQDIPSLGILTGDRVKNSISPAFGFKYEAKPYEQTTNNKISIDDPRGWVYQYEAGVFYQQNVVATKPATIELYVYTGTTLIDISSGSATISGNNIESKTFSKNLLTNITTDLDIYISSIGDDLSGDGTEVLPYLTLEKVLTLLSFTTISNNSTITIHLSNGSFEITSYVVDLFSTINFKDGSSIVFKGNDLILSKTLTSVLADFLIPFKYNVIGLTETSLDYYRGCYVKNNDDNYFPIASSSDGVLYTQKSLNFTTVYNLTTTITSSLIDPFGVLAKGVKEGAISFKNILFDFSNNIEVYSEIGCSFKFDTCYFDKNISFFSNINLNSQYTIFKSLDFKTNGLVNVLNSVITDFKADLTDYNDKVLENIVLYKNNFNFDYIIDSNCLIKGDSLVKSGVGLLQVFNLQEKIIGENIWAELDSATELIQFINNKNITFVFDDVKNYKLTNDQITSLGDASFDKFVLVGNVNKEYFNTHICGLKLKSDISAVNYPIVFCRENNKIYRYIANGLTYTSDNEYVLSTSDGGDTRYVTIDYNQIKIDNNGDVVNHTGTPITNIKTANIDANSLATGLVDNDKLATQGYVEQFVNTTLGAIVSLQGDWDADTDSPSIIEATSVGYAWRVSINGATNLGGITDWRVGDLVVKTATGWLKIDNEDISALWGNISGTVTNQTDLVDYINSVLPDTMTLTVHDETELVAAVAAVNAANLSGVVLFKNNISLSTPITLNLESITLDINNYSLIQNENLLSISGQSFVVKNGRLIWDNLVYNNIKYKNNTGIALLGVGIPNSVSLSATFDSIIFSDYVGVDLIDNDIPCITIPDTSVSAGTLSLNNCYFYSNTGPVGGPDTLLNSPFTVGVPSVQGFTFNVFTYKGMFEKSGSYSKCVKLLVTEFSNKIYLITDGSVNIANPIVSVLPIAGEAVIDYSIIPTSGVISLSITGTGSLINYRSTLVDLTNSETLVQKDGVLYKIPLGDTLATFLTKSSNLSDLNDKQISLNNLSNVASATNEYVLTKDTVSGNATWKEVTGGSNFSRTIYVDSKNGNDATATGQLDKMFKTLEGVVNAIGTVVNLYSTITGDIQAGNTITNCSSVANVSVGQTITHANIPFGAVVTNVVGTTITMSETMTASTGATIKVWTPYNVICQGDFVPDSTKNYLIDGITWITNRASLLVQNFKFMDTPISPLLTSFNGALGDWNVTIVGNGGAYFYYMDLTPIVNTKILIEAENIISSATINIITAKANGFGCNIVFNIKNSIASKNNLLCDIIVTDSYYNANISISAKYGYGCISGYAQVSGLTAKIDLLECSSGLYAIAGSPLQLDFYGDIYGDINVGGFDGQSSRRNGFNIFGKLIGKYASYITGGVVSIFGNSLASIIVSGDSYLSIHGSAKYINLSSQSATVSVDSITSGGTVLLSNGVFIHQKGSYDVDAFRYYWHNQSGGIFINNGMMSMSDSKFIKTNGTFINKGTITERSGSLVGLDNYNSNGNLINEGRFIFVLSYAGTQSHFSVSGGMFINKGTIETTTNNGNNGYLYMTNGGKFQSNGGKIIMYNGQNLFNTDVASRTMQILTGYCNVVGGVSTDKDGNTMTDEIGGTLIENINLI